MQQLLAEAMRARRAEVLARLPAEPPSIAAEPAAADVEETLRTLMVKLFPRLRDGRATPAERHAALDAVRSLGVAAEREDLRFLDAWNNMYEVLGQLDEPDGAAFLVRYAGLLERHAERLAGAPCCG